MNVLRLALAHMRFHWKRTLLLAGCAIICFLLPLLIPQLVNRIQTELYRQSNLLPLIIGSRNCSPLDLTLHGLYLRNRDLPVIRYGVWQEMAEKYGDEILPIHARFIVADQNHEFPIVGTHLDYFSQRALQFQTGTAFGTLGDCVIGANVAEEMNVGLGDHVISSPESVVSLAAAYPVRLNIVGILSPTNSVEDDLILVDLKTAWIIENLGHGHQDVSQTNDPNLIMERTEQGTVASPAVSTYTEITAENLASFHFHGDEADFPITAVLVTSHDQRTLDLLSGKAQRSNQIQAVQSQNEVSKLLAVVFQVQWLLLAVVLVVGVATILLFTLVIALSIQIRADEMQTMFKLGASRGFTWQLHAAEILSILLGSFLIASLSTAMILSNVSDRWVQWIL